MAARSAAWIPIKSFVPVQILISSGSAFLQRCESKWKRVNDFSLSKFPNHRAFPIRRSGCMLFSDFPCFWRFGGFSDEALGKCISFEITGQWRLIGFFDRILVYAFAQGVHKLAIASVSSFILDRMKLLFSVFTRWKESLLRETFGQSYGENRIFRQKSQQVG